MNYFISNFAALSASIILFSFVLWEVIGLKHVKSKLRYLIIPFIIALILAVGLNVYHIQQTENRTIEGRITTISLTETGAHITISDSDSLFVPAKHPDLNVGDLVTIEYRLKDNRIVKLYHYIQEEYTWKP